MSRPRAQHRADPGAGSSRRLTLGACCAVHALQDGLSAALFVLLPVLAQTFGLSYAQVGVLRAANNAAMALFEIPSGFASERLGARSLLVFGLAAAGAGFALLPLAGSLPGLAACLLLAGVGAAFQHALSSSIVSEAYPLLGRRAALGTYNAAGDGGKLALTGVVGLALGLGVAWQGVVIAGGVAALAGAVALLVVLTRVSIGGRPQRDPPSPARALAADWGIVDRRAFAALSLVVCLDTLVQTGFLTFVAFAMIAKQVPVALAGAAVVLTLAGGVLGKFACGHLAERFGVERSFAAVQVATVAGIVAVLALPPVPAYLALPLVGLFLQGSSSITYATVSDLVRPERHSRGFALIYSVASGASVLGPVAFGYLGDHLGMTATMVAMALVAMLTLPLAPLLRPAGATARRA